MRGNRHHQSVITAVRPLGALRLGDKFYVVSNGQFTGHRREVAAITHKGRVTTVLCSDGGSVSSNVGVEVAIAQDWDN